MKHVDNSEFSRWFLIRTKGDSGFVRLRIRRYRKVGGKTQWESYPYCQYSHLETEAEHHEFLDELNHKHKTHVQLFHETYGFEHPLITQDLLEGFRSLLIAEIPDKNHAKNLYSILIRHCLHWFINRAGLEDLIEWKRYQSHWGQALRCELEPLGGLFHQSSEYFRIFDEKIHPDSLKKRIQVLNRFLKYLHSQIPNKVSFIQLEPVSKAQMRLYKAMFAQDPDYIPGRFIEPDHWKTITAKGNSQILPLVKLGYDFGLRRSEALGMKHEDIYEDCVDVLRQLERKPVSGPIYGPLKSRKPRKVEYWFSTPEQTYDLILPEEKKMHPETYGALFAEDMRRLNMPYTLHDLRRSFITRAFRAGKVPRDIQLAVGHESIMTTMRYAQDDRNIKARRRFVPKASAS